MDSNELKNGTSENEMPDIVQPSGTDEYDNDAAGTEVPADTSREAAPVTPDPPKSEPEQPEVSEEAKDPELPADGPSSSDSAEIPPDPADGSEPTDNGEEPVTPDPPKSEPAQPEVSEEANEPELPADNQSSSDSAETPPNPTDGSEAPDDGEEKEKKKKKRSILLLILTILILLLALGTCWFFLLGPGATRYRVKFDTAGGESVDDIWVRSGRSVDLPDAERAGYDFKGWMLNGKAVEDPYSPKSDVTLTAKWEGLEFTVNFNSTGGMPASYKDTFRAGDVIGFPQEPTKQGYAFLYWVDDEGKTVSPGATMPAGDLYLFAEWAEKSFKITFDTDGGTAIQPVVLREGDPFPEVSTTKKNYTFDHWEDPKGNKVAKGDILPAQDVILHAKWKRDTFTVSFDSRGGSDVSPIKVNAGDTLSLPASPTRKMYIFNGWEDKNGTPILEGALLDPHDITLYARWERAFFTVEFDSRGGSHVPAVSVEAGKELILPAAPTRAGYRFVRWEDEHGTPIYDHALLSTEDIILYAVWEQVKVLNVTMHKKAGEIDSINETDTSITVWIKTDKATTSMLNSNMDVTWKYSTNGVLTSVKVWDDQITFIAKYVDDQTFGLIVAESEDGQTFNITVHPLDPNE